MSHWTEGPAVKKWMETLKGTGSASRFVHEATTPRSHCPGCGSTDRAGRNEVVVQSWIDGPHVCNCADDWHDLPCGPCDCEDCKPSDLDPINK